MRQWKLQYDEPARTWFEALPIGNGELGAMCFGGTDEDRIGINLDTLWSGTGKEKGNDCKDRDWDYLRSLIREKRFGEAEEYARVHMLGDWTECYLPAGDLILELDKESGENDTYHRELSLNRGLVSCRWENGKVQYEKETFVSMKERVLAVRLCAQKGGEPARLSLTVSLDSPLSYEIEKADGSSDTLFLTGRAPVYAAPSYFECENPIIYEEGKGTAFTLGVLVSCEKGEVVRTGSSLKVEAEGEVTIYLTGGTDFERNVDLKKEAVDELKKAEKIGYEELKTEHEAMFKEYFERVDFSLGGEDKDAYDDMPTIRRIEKFREDGEDLNLSALLFQYGRYLLIACSKPGTQCANLQGIWNRLVRAPWSSNYTVNINTEMNYWMAENCNLSEFHEPLFDLMERTAKNGQETARELYGLDGWVSHHNVDIWGHSTPVGGPQGGNPCTYALWPMSPGWLCRHLWEHYCYTMDKDFLRETAFPLIDGAVRFYLGYLVEQDGYLVTMPSTSPENSFLDSKGEAHSVFMGSTMDMAILKELFDYYVKICDILGEEGVRAQAEAALGKFPPFKVGKYGQLQEWYEDFEEAEVHHRHVSHLYGVYPANVIGENEKELREACKGTLNRRGDEGTGWCIAWKAAIWARLKEGDRAYDLLKNQMNLTAEEEVNMFGGGIYGNLFCAHPPFQIDGNFGYAAAVGEMLLQSQDGDITLLPAIPKEWKNGQVKGLKARGGYTVDFAWRDGKVTEVKVTAILPGEIMLQCNGEEKLLSFTEDSLEKTVVF